MAFPRIPGEGSPGYPLCEGWLHPVGWGPAPPSWGPRAAGQGVTPQLPPPVILHFVQE